jgi:uncharacterized protein YjbJ (UPF0337 family)
MFHEVKGKVRHIAGNIQEKIGQMKNVLGE